MVAQEYHVDKHDMLPYVQNIKAGTFPVSETPESEMTLEAQLKAAREDVNKCEFSTDEWEAKMTVVRGLCARIDALAPVEEFFSVDSGFHRTRLPDGRIF